MSKIPNNKLRRINRLNTKFKKIQKPENKKSTKNILKFIIYVLLFFVISVFLLIIILYKNELQPLSAEDIKKIDIAETSTIYDRNGKEIHRIYKENRTYVDYEEISKNIINALVAGEDKRFWENPGVDIIGLIRAGIKGIAGGGDRFAGTSTLTQQLVRNTLITKKINESAREGIDRKIKEIFLSYNLTKSISKEKILELYLNKIEFGHNSFGIEEASKRFFNKSAKDADIFEGSVLASLPKGPTAYSPYNFQWKLVSYISYSDGTFNEKNEKNIEKLVTKEDLAKHQDLVDSLKEKISKLKGKEIAKGSNKYMLCGIEKKFVNSKKYIVDSDGCLVLEYSEISDFISYIEIKSENKSIFYYPGRKDYILGRMLEDNYINFDEYKNAVLKGIGFEFNRLRDKMDAPHFVFYVKEYLESKYDPEVINTKGLKIYTTLDLDLQAKAEEMVAKQAASNGAKFNAKNSALVSIDNKTGGILVMVGNEDYFSENGKGNVNVITSKLQPGSSFKPFVYSLAMAKNQIGTHTPVYDVKTVFPGKYEPKNFDGKFMGKISISTALNYSRNIPAIKMIYLTSGPKEVIEFMHKLGATSLENSDRYGASLALGTGEMTPLDLAKAYTVFANMGEKVEINPILKIVDSKGNIIEERKEIKKEKVMSAGQAFLINNILSDSSTRPYGWNSYLDIGRPAAVKTGTSTKPVNEKGKKDPVQYPANLFVAGYTPQITTIVWSGNISGETMKYSGSGLEASAPLWKRFMQEAHKDKKVEKWEKPDDVKKLTVSEISGLLPNPEFPNNFLVSSYFVNPPKNIDDSYRNIEYDALCNGKISDLTPVDARKSYITLRFKSLKPDLKYWEDPVQAWARSSGYTKYGANNGENITIKNEVCQRSNGGSTIIVKSDLDSSKSYNIGGSPIKIAYSSTNKNILKVEILVNGEIIQTFDGLNKVEGGIVQNIFIPEKHLNKKVSVEIKAIDEEYFSSSEKKEIYVGVAAPKVEETPTNSGNTENIPTKAVSNLDINITNPKNGNIRINKEDYFNLRFNIPQKENIANINILIDDIIVSSLGAEGTYVLPINQTNKMEEGKHNLKIQAIDLNGNQKEKTLQFEIL